MHHVRSGPTRWASGYKEDPREGRISNALTLAGLAFFFTLGWGREILLLESTDTVQVIAPVARTLSPLEALSRCWGVFL